MKGLVLVFFFILSSCYIYKPYTGVEIAPTNTRSGLKSSGVSSIRGNESRPRGNAPQQAGLSESLNRNEKTAPVDPMKDQEKQNEIETMKKKEMERNTNMEMSQNMDPRKRAEMEIERQRGMDDSSQLVEMPASAKSQSASTTSLSASSKGNEMPMGILKTKIKPNKYYKIKVEENWYKIQADQWEGDTLVSHILRKPKKVLRFHENQIDEEALEERRFSKSYSDLFTIGAYVAGGAAVLLLLL